MWDYLPMSALTDDTATSCSFECHSCGCTVAGYQMGELIVDHGWRLHSTGYGRPYFVMCGNCVEHYKERWERRAAA